MAAGLARARQARVGRLAAWALEQTPQGGTAPGRTATKKTRFGRLSHISRLVAANAASPKKYGGIF